MESKDERAARQRLEARLARVEGELRTLKASVERRAREIKQVDDVVREHLPAVDHRR